MVDILDGIVFVYNYAVVVSAMYVVQIGGVDDRISMFAVGGAFALFWTIYFKYGMLSRLVSQTTGEDSESYQDDI